MDGPLHFLVAEDQTIFRDLLVSSIRQEFPGCRITEASSLADLRALSGQDFSLAVVDLELNDGVALDWLEGWVRGTKRKVMILSAVSEDYTLFRALRSPIMGYVHKEDKTETFKLGLRCVLAGSVFFSPLMQSLRQRMNQDPGFFSKILSDREQKILELIGGGMSNEEVSALLGIKPASVKDHRKNIMTKLDLHTQADLMRYAAQKGFTRIG
ncbi:MAG TPA: response regulator transcription factor [Opitutaceae bacterium]|jgi:two-component system response regulator NreC|nr:response regulator transcription factor [Opitutaceae bacterium]